MQPGTSASSSHGVRLEPIPAADLTPEQAAEYLKCSVRRVYQRAGKSIRCDRSSGKLRFARVWLDQYRLTQITGPAEVSQ